MTSPQQGHPPVETRETSWNQGGEAQKVSQYIHPVQQSAQPAVNAQGGWDTNPGTHQSPQYIPPRPQGTSPVTTEQVHSEPQQAIPIVANVQANEILSTTISSDAHVPTQFISTGPGKEHVEGLSHQDIPRVTNANPVHSEPPQAIPPAQIAEPIQNAQNQGTVPVESVESNYGIPQPVPPMSSGTPVYSQTHQHATPPIAREEPTYTVTQPEIVGVTTNQLPRTTAPMTETEPAPATSSWNPIFEGCVPSATGVAFLNTVFDCLDTKRMGLITPEQYSAFNDVQGYELHEDICKFGVHLLYYVSANLYNQGKDPTYLSLGIMQRTLQTMNCAPSSKTTHSIMCSRNVPRHQIMTCQVSSAASRA